MRCRKVERRAGSNEPVHVCDADKNPDSPSFLLGVLDLVKVTRIIVVNGRPQPRSQITHLDAVEIGLGFGPQFLLRAGRKINKEPPIQHGLTRNCPQVGMAIRHKLDISIVAKTMQVCELRDMFRRILLSSFVLMLVCGASVYGQNTKTVKIKPPKKAKVEPVKKPPKAPKPPAPKLSASEKAVQKTNEKQIREQQKAFKKQTEQKAKETRAQQKAYTKTLRAMEKQSKKKQATN